ncbi:MAG: type II toxin-antitoxin system HicA family toxin [Nitrospira sp.]|nr:type II toxin-antitoxin system HicA family toxin [Nitrospira sp.]
MSRWSSPQASHVLSALLRIGCQIERTTGSHRVLQQTGRSDVMFAFHDRDEIGPRMLACLAKVTELTPEDV